MSSAQDWLWEEPPGPKPKVSLSHISDTDAAWIAGWLCADGSIATHDTTIRIRWVITDRDPLERITRIVGGNKMHKTPPSGYGKKPRYVLQYGGHRAAALIHRCWPWMSLRYKSRYATAASRWRFVPDGVGQKITAKDVAIIKREIATGGRGSNRKLAKRFGVSDGLIAAIKYGRVWRDVKAAA